MDSLRALLAAKKAEKDALLGQERPKYAKAAELEEARLKRLREEEEKERLEQAPELQLSAPAPPSKPGAGINKGGQQQYPLSCKGIDACSLGTIDSTAACIKYQFGGKFTGTDITAIQPPLQEQKRRRMQGGTSTSAPDHPTAAAPAAPADAADTTTATAAASQPPQQLPREEVTRRLRALGQPIMLFGEEDHDRLVRLQRVERDVSLVDDARGGQQENIYLEIRKQEKLRKAAEAGKKPATGDKKGQGKGEGARDGEGPQAPSTSAAAADGPAADVAAAFARAAEALAAQRAEEALPLEGRIAKWIRKWCEEWGADLEARPQSVKGSGAGVQATLVYKQSMSYMEPLYDRLAKQQVDEELVVGLWMMVQAVQARNYLNANDIYLRLAIGNAAWPIGVTQVGIHERSAREKISHVMNATGQAHIMNDEATRKYLQAIKRLISNMQRLYPTDPSRSIDFNAHANNAGMGAAGAGSDKLALLAAEERGETAEALALPAAPHYLDKDGSVRIPPKWDSVLAREKAALAKSGALVAEGPPKTPPRPSSKTPPRTPPHTPPQPR